MNVTDVLEFAAEDLDALDRPVMLVGLEGWFDVGGAATQAVEAFTSADHAVVVGAIDPDPFYDFTQQRPHVSVDDDVREIVWPGNDFVLQRNQHRGRPPTPRQHNRCPCATCSRSKIVLSCFGSFQLAQRQCIINNE